MLQPIPWDYLSLSDLMTEATMLAAAVAIFVTMWRLYRIYGTREWLFPTLSIGLFALGTVLDLLDEFYRLPELVLVPVENNIKMVGMIFFSIGMLAILGNLIKVSYTDPLTGIYNRRHWLRLLQKELHQAELNGQPLTLAFLDIDHFGAINDQLGHLIGDVVLVDVANRLKRALRCGEILGRFGGDEFVILMPDTTAPAGEALMVKLADIIAKMRILEGNRRVGISYGLACYPAEGDQGDRLLGVASRRMNQARQSLAKAD